jgi:hypothetical protein
MLASMSPSAVTSRYEPFCVKQPTASRLNSTRGHRSPTWLTRLANGYTLSVVPITNSKSHSFKSVNCEVVKASGSPSPKNTTLGRTVPLHAGHSAMRESRTADQNLRKTNESEMLEKRGNSGIIVQKTALV